MPGSGILPTVKIVSADSPQGFIVINESDLQDHHVLFDRLAHGQATDAPLPLQATSEAPREPDETQVVKGSRGKFYVKRGAAFVSRGFETEGEAIESMNSNVATEPVAENGADR